MDPGRVVFDISSDEESSEPKGEDFDWLAAFLNSEDKETFDDDSDDVVVVAEVKPKLKSNSKSSKSMPVKDVDDDCVILDGDPDKTAGVVDDSPDGGGEDDLLVVGETGQIACRDYPHPRHHCVAFPFNTTPHEKYCDLCHCYVCDSHAPCAHWATSASSIDHCHATDKEETWKSQRRNFRLGKNVPLPSPKVPDTLCSLGLPQLNPVSPLNIIQLSPNSRPQSQVSRPSTIQGCSPTSFSIPTILSRGRSQPMGPGLHRNRFQPRIVSGGQLLGGNRNIRRGKGHFGNSGHRLVPSPTMFKRIENAGLSMPMNQSAHYSSNSRTHANTTLYARNPPRATVLNDSNPVGWENVNSGLHQQPSEPNLGHTVLNTPPARPHVYDSPLPPPNVPHNFYQQGNEFQNNGQSIYQHANNTQNPVENIYMGGIGSASVKDTSSVSFTTSWVNNASQSNQQPPVEHPQLQNRESLFEPADKVSSPEVNVRTTNISADFNFDDWFLENQSVPVFSDGSVPPQSNIFSAEPAAIDAGLLMFDFETSWNGLTRA